MAVYLRLILRTRLFKLMHVYYARKEHSRLLTVRIPHSLERALGHAENSYLDEEI